MAELAQEFDFELVSPEKKLMETKVWQVTLPGGAGTFGVRAGHQSLVSTIQPGVIEIVEREGATPQSIFVAGGFADVTATQCTVLAEEAETIDKMDQQLVEDTVKDLEEKILVTKTDGERAFLHNRLAVEKAKLAALSNV